MAEVSPLRLLFVKESQNWPRSSGHDVHGYQMMRALAARGHSVSLATITPTQPAALEGLRLEAVYSLIDTTTANSTAKWSAWESRFTRYYGIEEIWARALDNILSRYTFDAVVVVARHLLPLLKFVRGPTRIWYPADDPVLHHLSRVRIWQRASWRELLPAAINSLYERAFATQIDRIWVVSPADRLASRLISGCRHVDTIANGMDSDHFSPTGENVQPFSCVFWGRLDFGPNLDALKWFLREHWPGIRKDYPRAVFAICGFNPTAEIQRSVESPGVELYPDLPDLRREVTRRSVVVLPFISGGGIKNKLLEAAALGMPIICTQRALSGTKGKPAVLIARSSKDWSKLLGRLWSDSEARRKLGAEAREWVICEHTWDAAARIAERALAQHTRRAKTGRNVLDTRTTREVR